MLPVNPIASALAHPAASDKLSSRPAAPVHVQPDAAAEFETFVLQTFIQEMLPKQADNVFGRGIAGDIWRSMLSEKLAYEAAGRGEIGIARFIHDKADTARPGIDAAAAGEPRPSAHAAPITGR